MVRTWALTIGLALLLGSVCVGQQGYVDMAPIGIELTGMTPLNYNGGFTQGSPIGDGPWLTQTLEGVKANLAVFEQCGGTNALPMDLLPYWGNLPDMSQMQTGTGLQQPEQIGSLIDIGGIPNSTGLPINLVLPISGLTVDMINTFQLPDFANMAANL
jgi:hypothetical protein